MATLSGAVNATEGLWTISADLDDAIDYLQVEDEIVRVVGNFPSSTYAPTGAVTPPKIRVEREAGGTTAASHADGTTLTPVIPPSAGGGAAEAGTVVVTLTGTETTYGHLYRGDEDPAVDFGAELQPGDLWIDTTGGVPFTIWTRTEANDTWVVAPIVIKDPTGIVLALVEAIDTGGSDGAIALRTFDALGDPANTLTIDATGVFSVANADGSVAISIVAGDIYLSSGDFALSILADGTVTLGDGGNGARFRIATNGAITFQNADQSGTFGIDATGAITLSGLQALEMNGTGTFLYLPTADPVVAGALWNDTGTVKVSAG